MTIPIDKIGSGTLLNASQLIINNLSANYVKFEIVFSGLYISSGSQVNLTLRTSTDNGATFSSGPYEHRMQHAGSSADVVHYSGTADTEASLVRAISSTTNDFVSGVIEIFDPLNSGTQTTIITRAGGRINADGTSNLPELQTITSQRAAVEANNAVIIFVDNSSPFSMVYTIYGYKADTQVAINVISGGGKPIASTPVTTSGVVTALSGASLTPATINSSDLVLIQDINNANSLRTITAQSIANLVSLPSSQGVNLLHNGNFSVFQRGAYSSSLTVNGAAFHHGSIMDVGSSSSGTTVTAYALDRWQVQVGSNVHVKVLNCSIASIGNFFGSKYGGFAAGLWVQSDSASGIVRMCQTIPMTDLPSYIQSQSVTLSFVTGIGPSFSSSTITIKVYAGTDTTEKSGINGGFVGSTAIINVTESAWNTGNPFVHVHTGTTPSNCTQLAVEISYTAAGSGAADDALYIWDMQLELGSSATTFQNKGFEQTLLECQPFYCKSFPYGTKPAQNIGTGTGEFMWAAARAGALGNTAPKVMFPRKMYGDWWSQSPTVTTYNPSATNSDARDYQVPGDCSSTSVANLSTDGFNITTTGNASTAVGNQLGLHWSAESEIT